jgi:Zn-dependent protease/CBS domain-containing protein
VYIHFTFFLLLALLGVMDWARTHHLPSVLEGLALFLCIFLCVLLHEFGHALTAKRYGVKTKDITLLPIGGVARLERMPSKPIQEFWVAVAGPAVNVVIAAVLYTLLLAFPALASVRPEGPGFVERLAQINLGLVLFNLLPAFPMDGGRVVRSLLAMRMDYARATRIAANLGQAMAVGFAVWGIMSYNPVMLFIAFFVWIGANGEASVAQFRSVVEGARVEDAMLTYFLTIKPDTRLRQVEEMVMAGSQEDFPVVDDVGKFHGILTTNDFLRGLIGHGEAGLVEDCMRREVPHVTHDLLLEQVMHNQSFAGLNTLPVFRDDSFVGLLTMQNVNELVQIRTAIREHHIRKRGG